MSPEERLVVALDTVDVAGARALAETLLPVGPMLKLGLGLVPVGGIDLACELKARGARVFLDMKYFDIAATVANAVARTSELGLDIVTLQGDPHVVRAAVEGRGARATTALLAITVLTSLDQADIDEIGFPEPLADLALRRAKAAEAAGADGVIASPHEAARLRAELRPGFQIVTPGVRSAGQAAHDQKRVATPADAIANGADRVVIGRQITRAEDPAAAARAAIAEIKQGLERRGMS